MNDNIKKRSTMNKNILLAIAVLSLLSLLIACTDDNSTYATSDNYIKISGIEKAYNAISFSGDKLNIQPKVESSFDLSDMTYLWTYYNTQDANRQKTDKRGRGYYVQPDTICKVKDLSFPVKLSDGEYTLVFTAKSKSTGFFQQNVTSLLTKSSLSHGFYICKENEEGNTDVDLFLHTSNKLIPDVIKNTQGKALPGKPRAFNINHQLGYTDPKTEKEAAANFLCITTEKDSAYWIRALDCKTIKTLSNFNYEQVPNLKPYRIVRGFFTEFLLTNQGIFHGYTASQHGNGILGEQEGYGASTHVVQSVGDHAFILIYWALPEHSLYMMDYNGGLTEVVGKKTYVNGKPVMFQTQKLNNLECLYSGLNFTDKKAVKAYFLFQDKKENKKVLYEISPDVDKATVDTVKIVDPNSHFAQASRYAICAKSATIAYAVHQNKVYSYSLGKDAKEKELTFKGLPANEEITFLSNRYFLGDKKSNFDYLIVGTQTGNTYKLYFYNIVGGEPDGVPKYTTSGKGILKSLGYIDPTVQDLDDGAVAPVLDE